VGDREVLHCPPDWHESFPQKVRCGNPLLFPIASGLSLDGRPALYRDGPAEFRLPQHGFVRDLPWHVMQLGESSVTCRVTDSALTRVLFPWEFTAELKCTVSEAGLEVVFTAENCAARPMPVQFGFHPYFQLEGPQSDYVVRVPTADAVYLAAPPARPAPHPELRDIPLDDSLRDTRFYDGVHEGRMTLVHQPSGRSVTVEADAATLPCWAIWRESAESDYVCLEPWSAGVNALNTGTRLRHLAPGETFCAVMRISIT
jgi:galactose mutarotase-like enzyme